MIKNGDLEHRSKPFEILDFSEITLLDFCLSCLALFAIFVVLLSDFVK